MPTPAHQRLISLLTTGTDATSPTSATYKVTTGVPGFADFKTITFIAKIIAPASGALDVLIEHSPDQGTSWYEYVHFTQVAAGATKRYTYGPALNDSLVEVGENNLVGDLQTTTMTLGAGSVAGGHWFDMLRVRYVAGVGTSAGATQVVNVLGIADSGAA
jgi:hypothetical protein